MSYELIDLVRERAEEHNWELVFDSGPNSDHRTVVWEHRSPDRGAQLLELEVTFNADGRIVQSEKRRDGERCDGIDPTSEFASTQAHLDTLRMI